MNYVPIALRKLKRHLPELIILFLLVLAYVFHLFEQLFSLSATEEISLIILIGTAILWIFETIPLYITSLNVLFLQVMWLLPFLEDAGVKASRDDFFLSFFSDITLLFMGGFVLSSLLNKYGLASLMANWMLQKTGNKPDRVLLGIMLVGAILSMWMSNTATAAMMFAIIVPILSQLPAGSPFAKGLALAIPFSCNLGGLGTPIGTPPNAIAMEYLQQVGLGISFLQWMLLSLPMLSILLFFLWKLLLRLFPAGEITFTIEKPDEVHFSLRQKLVLVVFMLTILGWLTSGMTGISTGTVGLMVVIVSFGLNLLGTRDFRGISWDILFMLGGGLCLGVGLNKSGLTTTIAEAIPIESGFWFAFVSIVILAALMTTFMSNTATANLLIPVAISLPQNSMLLAIAISLMCSTAMALPVSTPPNAIAFGSGLLQTKDMLRGGLIITFVAFFMVILASIFYIPLFF